ncbi:pyridoxine biosynthesis protein [Rhizina undulata]
MASSVSRLSARLAAASGSQLRRQVVTRGMRTSARVAAAQNFSMPAMSPTMTEGTIASWKVKEGDQFSAGDVLLEIETDKAQMDVEAQEDGVLAKITVNSGTKAVQVGTRIAVLAEPGDDLATLEIPAEDSAALQTSATASSPKKDVTSPPPSEKAPVVESSAKSTPETSHRHSAPKTPHTPSPSVVHLLKENGISKEDASKIPATGPKGRLLKGDVLAYLGRIEKAYPKELEGRIDKLGKLDLSNIKVAVPKKVEPKQEKKAEAKKVAEEKKESEVRVEISLSEVSKIRIKLQEQGRDLPLSAIIASAAAKANFNLPPSTLPPSTSELFDQILGARKPSKRTVGRFAPQITSIIPPPASKQKLDIIDILAGSKASARPPKVRAGPSEVGTNVFSLKVPVQEEKRASIFLQSLKEQLEKGPQELVL